MTTLEDLKTVNFPSWCPGCGNFAIWTAYKNAAVAQGWDNSNSVLVAGIGCHGHILNFLHLTSLEGLHGRAIPVAAGIKIANHNLNVFVFTGDGDCFGEGGNHFIHVCRRNHDLTILIHNNGVYGLTTGQTSPVTTKGYKSKSTPAGNPDEPLKPLSLAIASGATFVARAYAGNIPYLTELIIKANEHKGLAVIEILQPCVTFNKECTHPFFQENTYFLGSDYNPTNKEAALQKSFEWGSKSIPLGIFYQVERPTHETQFPQIAEKTLVNKDLVKRDISELLDKFR